MQCEYKPAPHTRLCTELNESFFFRLMVHRRLIVYDQLPEKIRAIVKENGAKARITNIEHDITQPDRYYIGTAHRDIMYMNDIPEPCLRKAFQMGPLGGFTKVSLGHNGTWALQGPAMNSFLLKNDAMAKEMRRDTKHVVVSPSSLTSGRPGAMVS